MGVRWMTRQVAYDYGKIARVAVSVLATLAQRSDNVVQSLVQVRIPTSLCLAAAEPTNNPLSVVACCFRAEVTSEHRFALCRPGQLSILPASRVCMLFVVGAPGGRSEAVRQPARGHGYGTDGGSGGALRVIRAERPLISRLHPVAKDPFGFKWQP